MPGESKLGYHVRNKEEKVRRRRPLSGHSKKKKSVSQMISDLVLYADDDDKENDLDFDINCIQKKPDLWMAAFDNPLEFIQYCRDRLDHERKLQEESRVLEDEIAECIRKMSADSVKQIDLLNDFFKVQTMNDKLQEMIMEERTNCQHLVGVNGQIESQLLLLSRKYQAALLLGKVDEKSVHHLLERNPKAVKLTDKMGSISEALKKCKLTPDDPECQDPVVGFYRIKQLENELADVKHAHKQEVKALKETLGLQELKFQMMDNEYKEVIKNKNTKIEETQNLLQKSLKENHKLRKALTKKEDTYFENVMRELTTVYEKYCSVPEEDFAELEPQKVERSNVKRRESRKRISALEKEVKEKTDLLSKCLQLIKDAERKMRELKDINTATSESHEAARKALRNKVGIYKKQIDELSDRRLKDNQGFLADVDMLRKMFTTFDKGIQRFARVFGEVNSEKRPSEYEQYEKLDALVQNEHPDRFKLWVRNSDPRSSVIAMSIWSDYFRQKLDDLDSFRKQLRRKDIEERHVNEEDVPPAAKGSRPDIPPAPPNVPAPLTNPQPARPLPKEPFAKKSQKQFDRCLEVVEEVPEVPEAPEAEPPTRPPARTQNQLDLSILGRVESTTSSSGSSIVRTSRNHLDGGRAEATASGSPIVRRSRNHLDGGRAEATASGSSVRRSRNNLDLFRSDRGRAETTSSSSGSSSGRRPRRHLDRGIAKARASGSPIVRRSRNQLDGGRAEARASGSPSVRRSRNHLDGGRAEARASGSPSVRRSRNHLDGGRAEARASGSPIVRRSRNHLDGGRAEATASGSPIVRRARNNLDLFGLDRGRAEAASSGIPLRQRSVRQLLDMSELYRGEPAELPRRGPPSVDREVEFVFRNMVEEESQSSSPEMSSPRTGSYHSSDAQFPSTSARCRPQTNNTNNNNNNSGSGSSTSHKEFSRFTISASSRKHHRNSNR